MIRKIFALALVLALTASLAACTASVSTPGGAVESDVTRNGDNTSRSGGAAGGERISEEKAQEIALKHAGLKADQVSGLRVEFYHDHWEYEYEIHAETGEIRSYDRDD